MIIQQRSAVRSRLGLLAGIAAVVGIAGAVAWSYRANPEPPAATAEPVQGGQAGADAQAPQVRLPAETPGSDASPVTSTAERPSQVPEEDWAALKAAFAKQPGSQGEPERVVSYLGYQRKFERWQAMEESKSVVQRRQLARELLDELPARLASGEFTMVEATMMSTVLLNDLEPNEAKREKQLQEWLAAAEAKVPQPEDPKQLNDKARYTEFKRRQAVAFAEWTAQAQRDQAKLDQALEDARRWYNSGAD